MMLNKDYLIKYKSCLKAPNNLRGGIVKMVKLMLIVLWQLKILLYT